MFTGLLKQFLKTAAVIAAGTSILLAANNALAAHTEVLSITKASWNAQKGELTIEGRGEAGFPVDASNASTPFQFLGSDTPGNNHRYKIVVSNPATLTPFPCRVHVEQDDGVEVGVAEADVSNAPPECQGGQNEPPVCTIDTPAAGNVMIFEGETVDYTGTATDIDGVIQGYSWTFDGGFPASSTAEDPGLVTYNTPGTYTTTFDATDDGGASCLPPDTRTITVQPIGGPPPLPNQTEFKMMMNYELGLHRFRVRLLLRTASV